MAMHGSTSEFNDSREDWTSYTERLQQYFTASDVDKQQAILLSTFGTSMYQQIQNLVAPAKPIDKSFTELLELVQTHRHPPLSVTVQ